MLSKSSSSLLNSAVASAELNLPAKPRVFVEPTKLCLPKREEVFFGNLVPGKKILNKRKAPTPNPSIGHLIQESSSGSSSGVMRLRKMISSDPEEEEEGEGGDWSWHSPSDSEAELEEVEPQDCSVGCVGRL
jgi:hypothetical protein